MLKDAKLKFPLESAVVPAVPDPLSVTVAPDPIEAGLMDPLIE